MKLRPDKHLTQTRRDMLHDGTKDAADFLAGATAFGAYFSYLPEVAAGLTVIWAIIRIYEWFRFRILGKKESSDKFL